MYIKSVTVHGFKSYKEPTTIYLSPQCNVAAAVCFSDIHPAGYFTGNCWPSPALPVR